MWHRLGAIVGFLRRPLRVTCLDCGFLAHEGADEVDKAARLVLPAKGTIPLREKYLNSLRCRRSLWVGFAVHGGPTLDEAIMRRRCEGFLRYKPGRSPEEHMQSLSRSEERKAQFGYTFLAAFLAAVLALVGQTVAKRFGLTTPAAASIDSRR